jgi:hypothetical protein
MKRRDLIRKTGASALVASGATAAMSGVGAADHCTELYCAFRQCPDCPDCCKDKFGGCFCE